MRLKDRIAIVTGAGSGFGRATSVAFAREGANVVLADVNEAGGTDTVGLVEEAGGKAELLVADIATRTGAEAVAAAAIERFGAIDVLVNNAGIAANKPRDTWDAEEEDWDEIIRVNLKSVYLCSRAAIPHLLTRGRGSIVNVASIAATRSVGGAAYAASKGAVISYTRLVARELAGRGIRVNCVSPGFMETPMASGERDGLDPDEQRSRLDGFARTVPMRRTGSADDIADAMVFLASDESSYVTGQELVVDGGYLVG